MTVDYRVLWAVSEALGLIRALQASGPPPAEGKRRGDGGNRR